MMANIRDQQQLSDPFPLTNSMVFPTMLKDSLQNSNTEISFIYCFDSGLFNLRTSQKEVEVTIRELLFADDCALAAPSLLMAKSF